MGDVIIDDWIKDEKNYTKKHGMHIVKSDNINDWINECERLQKENERLMREMKKLIE